MMVDMIINQDPDYMTEKQRARFVRMAAAYVDVNTGDVEIREYHNVP